MKIILKYISKLHLKKLLLIIFLLFIYIIICAVSYVNAVSYNIENTVFRLHVIANSDSYEDQNLKYLVRDNIINYINQLSVDSKTKQDTISLAYLNMDNIQEIAQNTIIDNGFDYPVYISIGNFPFPTKKYGDISLPAGFYDAIKVEIGNASGQNWWCVMFPPLCFVDATSGILLEDSKKIMQENLSSEEYALISEDSSDINFKFKIVEFFENINIKLAKSN